ncbi:MAG TPA: condensation domain-containing protein, partial [Thermoanaerobaculia bacterium]
MREAAVVLREGRLVAYVAPRGEAGAAGELRELLERELPEPMIPADLVFLDRLPLTASGKLDRRALPAPEPAAERPHVAPATPVEEILARIWGELLGRERIGVHDDFFELGGDSILSMQVVARAAQAGLRLSPRQISAHPTIAGLAALAEVAAGETEPEIVTGPVPLTPIQAWLCEQDLVHPEHFNQAVLLRPAQGLDAERLRTAVQRLLLHHDALRMRFAPGPAGWRQSNGGPETRTVCAEADLTGLEPDLRRDALDALAAAAQGSLDLREGPLLRVVLVRGGEAFGDRLLLVIHHLVIDGVSWRILLEDLESVYRQLGRGPRAVLPPKTTSFQRWAQTLAGLADAPEIAAQGEHWLRRLERGAPALPVDRETGPNDVGSARTFQESLSEEETRRLLQELPRALRTRINDVLLTALARALVEQTGQRTVLIDLEGHGRDDALTGRDVSRTVGWLTALYPLALELTATDPEGALREVREQLRAIPGGGLPYGLLRYLGSGATAEALRALPRPEVVFNYLGQLDA